MNRRVEIALHVNQIAIAPQRPAGGLTPERIEERQIDTDFFGAAPGLFIQPFAGRGKIQPASLREGAF